MAFTAISTDAGSDGSHYVSLRIDGFNRKVFLYDRYGDDMAKKRGDMWVYNIAAFGFPSGYQFTCISSWDIDSVEIRAYSNDGWQISSIVTLVASKNHIELLTTDFNVDRWIDYNGNEEDKVFELTRATSQTDEVLKMNVAKLLSGDVSAMRFNPSKLQYY